MEAPMTERLFEPTDTDDRRAWQRSVRGPFPDPSINTVGASHFGESDDTEAAAARLIAPNTGTLRAECLEVIADAEPVGATTYQVAETIGALLYSCAPRLTELRDGGWIVDSGQRRATPSGADAIVWILSERGRNRMEGER